MVCKNCNAEYDRSMLHCPYCGSENEKEAEVQKERIMRHFDDEAARIMAETPVKAVKKGTRIVVLFLGIGVAAVLLIALISILGNRFSVNMSFKQQEHHLEKMESYFQAGKYEEMKEYQKKYELYGNTYDKYYEVLEIISAWENVEEDLKQYVKVRDMDYEGHEKQAEDWKKMAVDLASRRIKKLEEEINDNAFLGNEDVLSDLLNEGLKMLESYGITREDLE